jgi:mRNA interferase MazF
VIFRGGVHEIKSLPGGRGREQQGSRLAVIVQSDLFATGTVTVAMTSTGAGQAIYRPEIEVDGVPTRILTDQIFSLDPSRLGEFRGSLDPDELAELDRALLLKLGLI